MHSWQTYMYIRLMFIHVIDYPMPMESIVIMPLQASGLVCMLTLSCLLYNRVYCTRSTLFSEVDFMSMWVHI